MCSRFVIVFLCFVASVSSHASYFASDSHCSTALAVGSSIMGKEVINDNTHSIVVLRDGVPLSSGDAYVPGELLTVSISPPSGTEYALQVSSGDASFPNGACSNARRAGAGDLQMPQSGSVTINGGTATSKGPVTLTTDFTLNCCNTESTPGTASPTNQATYAPSQTSTIAGTIMCLVFTVFGIGFCRYYLRNYEYILSQSHHWVKVPSIIALVTGGLAVILIADWATTADPASLDQHYLGAPNWKTNTFAWHPVLMVGGLFFGQVVAINDWNLLPTSHSEAKGWHVFFQSAALICMFTGLAAVMKGYLEAKAPGFNTVHSWVGMAAIILFCLNYALGMFMGFLTAFYPESIFRRAFDLRRIHRVIGLSSLGMTTNAICSGVMDALPTGVCIYPATNIHYGAIFPSCQIAYSMTVMVLIAALFTVLAVSLRGDHTGPLSSLHQEKEEGKWIEIPDQ